MENPARRNLRGIPVAIAAALGGVALVLLLESLIVNSAPSLLVLVLVLLATSWLGAWPTFVATLLCLTADTWFFREPPNSLRVESSGDLLRLLAFALIGLVLGLAGEKRLHYLSRAERRQRFLANLAAATQRL